MMKLKFEIQKPKYEIDDEVIVQHGLHRMGIVTIRGTVKSREIKMEYNPDTMKEPKYDGWMYQVMVGIRDWRTIPEHRVYTLAEIENSVRELGIEGTSKEYNMFIPDLEKLVSINITREIKWL
jgi:hypothetical protein